MLWTSESKCNANLALTLLMLSAIMCIFMEISFLHTLTDLHICLVELVSHEDKHSLPAKAAAPVFYCSMFLALFLCQVLGMMACPSLLVWT